jgi:hypothetical protein
MLGLFLQLFAFFLNFRKKSISSRIKIDDETITPSPRQLTVFNKLIIGWVYFLSAFALWRIISVLIDGFAKLLYGAEYAASPLYVYYLSPVYKVIFPFKNLFIALSFSYLYYYQGIK